ncbi:hypothetical protein UA08_01811 [Talaromyces atroroseus]|uniref:Uncharacterized protein n=1 Tax=Talaromyces atroroseus TaxID=1441469 RepID=A0A1Q5QA75_TALAT|nr:hypothetical protein UA08_01811 [Talaromyces atroroseus]OKL62847.1 hypothetical protein UA08_01811 [Talaromyces atroroseus]
MSNDGKIPDIEEEIIKLRGEVEFVVTYETYIKGDPRPTEAILRTMSINLFLWDDRLLVSGLQFLRWRCSHEFKLTIKREADPDSAMEWILPFQPRSDTGSRTLTAEVDIPMRFQGVETMLVEIGSNGPMPVYDIRGVVLGFRNMHIRIRAFGEDEDCVPKSRHVYKDEAWNRDCEILARHHLDSLLMDGLDGL